MLICKVHDALAAMLASEASPLLKNAEWFRANRSGPMGKIVSQLCGVGQTTVSNCIAEASKSGGVLRSSATCGGEKKDPREVKMKNQEPESGPLFGLLQRRIADVHKSGMVNTRSNLPKYVTEDPCGPRLPSVCPRVSRRKLSQMGLLRCMRRELIIAERSKPYVARRRTSYCIRRTKRIDGDLPRRPMIWMGATYISKDAWGDFAWAATGVA